MINNLNNALQEEADYFGSIIQDLQEQNKRYREALEDVLHEVSYGCSDIAEDMISE